MSALSRRSLVASAAALPALAVPAVADAVGADADLLQLGARLTDINRRMESVFAADNPTDDELELAHNPLTEIVPKILARTATTREGLAVQVAACIVGCREIWADEYAEEIGELDTERPFIEAVARYAGVAHPNVTKAGSSADARARSDLRGDRTMEGGCRN